jgi:hypothetical protein
MPPFLDRVLQGYTNFAFMFRHNGSKEVDFSEDISRPTELNSSGGSHKSLNPFNYSQNSRESEEVHVEAYLLS